MNAVAFDTHAYIKKLVSVGFTEVQAEAQCQALSLVLSDQVATKADLKELEQRLIIKLGSMIVVAIGILAVLIKLL